MRKDSPNILTSKFVLVVFVVYFSDVIMVEEAVSLFEQWRTVVPPNTIIFSNLIKGRVRILTRKRHSVSVCICVYQLIQIMFSFNFSFSTSEFRFHFFYVKTLST